MKWPWKGKEIPTSAQPTVMEQAVKQILYDMAHFCRAYESAFHADPRVHAALEGRREVWLKLREMYLQDRPETEEEVRRRFMEAIQGGMSNG